MGQFNFFSNRLLLGLLGVLNSFLRCVRPFCHCWCPPFSAGHAAFLFICLPGDFFTSPNRLLLGVLNAFEGCPPCFGTACPPSVRLVTLCLPSCWSLCPPCLPPVFLCLQSCLPSCWSLCPPCLPPVSLCLRSCLPSCWSLCPPCRPSVSFCLPSCLSSCWSLCPPCLPCVCLCLRSCLPSCWSLCPPCLRSVSLCICLPGLDCCIRLRLAILYLSPSSGLHLQSSTCVSLPLHLIPARTAVATFLCLPALGVASSSCRAFRF